MIIITTISVDKEHAPAQEVHRVYPFVAGRKLCAGLRLRGRFESTDPSGFCLSIGTPAEMSTPAVLFASGTGTGTGTSYSLMNQ